MASGRWVVTGGAGYIGAHVVRALLHSGRRVLVVDDLSTGLPARVPSTVDIEQVSVLDAVAVTALMQRVRPAGVMHLAGKKSPAESVTDPLRYARENAVGMISLLEAVRATGVSRVVFSSSCSVYGTPDADVVAEDAPTSPQTPYGESKLYSEQVLTAAAAAHGLAVTNLRYFNVVGAAAPELRDTGQHNLIPLALRALSDGGRLRVFGGDYPTPDGTCVRDYVDVRDVADAHVRAAEVLDAGRRTATYNVGRGEGSSVLEILDVVRAITGLPLHYDVVDRRPGDPARVVGSVERIARELGWRARLDITDMVTSAWAAESATHRPL